MWEFGSHLGGFLTQKSSGSGPLAYCVATSSKSVPLFGPLFPHLKEENPELDDMKGPFCPQNFMALNLFHLQSPVPTEIPVHNKALRNE